MNNMQFDEATQTYRAASVFFGGMEKCKIPIYGGRLSLAASAAGRILGGESVKSRPDYLENWRPVWPQAYERAGQRRLWLGVHRAESAAAPAAKHVGDATCYLFRSC